MARRNGKTGNKPAFDTKAMSDMLRAASAAYPNVISVDSKSAELAELLRLEYVEANPNGANADGSIEIVASDKGNAFVAEGDSNKEDDDMEGNTGTVAADEGAPEIQVFSTAPTPPKRTRGPRTAKYPLEQLEVGNGFFVPKTADRPEPWNTVRSTVSQMKRDLYGEVTGEAPMTDKDGNELKDEDGNVRMRKSYTYSRDFAIFPGNEKEATDEKNATGAWVVRQK